MKSILSLSQGRALLRSGMDSQQRSLQGLTQAKPLSDKSRAGLRDTNSPEAPVAFLASDPTCCIALSLPVAHAPPGCYAMCPCHPLLCFNEPLHHCQLMAAGMETQLLAFPGFQWLLGVGLWSLLVEGLVSEAICLGGMHTWRFLGWHG